MPGLAPLVLHACSYKESLILERGCHGLVPLVIHACSYKESFKISRVDATGLP